MIELIDPLRQQPRVRVLAPVLRRRSGDPEGALPHVYWDDAARSLVEGAGREINRVFLSDAAGRYVPCPAL